jgi:hypothetical protein
MNEVEIKKILENKLGNQVMVFPEEQILVWEVNTSWILYSDNYMEIKESIGINITDLMKVVRNITTSIEKRITDKYIEITTMKKNEDQKYKLKYRLVKYEVDEEKILTLRKIREIQDKELSMEINQEMLKNIVNTFHDEIEINNNLETVYFADKNNTIYIPKIDVTEKEELQYTYDLELMQKVLEGIEGIKKRKMEILRNGLLRIIMELEEGIKFVLIMANSIQN